MANEKWRLDLKRDIRTVLEHRSPGEVWDADVDAVLAAVLPHFEAAYRRGEVAGKGRAGARLVEENERLRRELEQARKGLT